MGENGQLHEGLLNLLTMFTEAHYPKVNNADESKLFDNPSY